MIVLLLDLLILAGTSLFLTAATPFKPVIDYEPGLAAILECFMILAAENLGAKLVSFCDVTAFYTKDCFPFEDVAPVSLMADSSLVTYTLLCLAERVAEACPFPPF